MKKQSCGISTVSMTYQSQALDQTSIFGRGAKLPIYRNANGYWSVYVWNTKLHAPTNIALHRLIYMWFKSPGGLDPSVKIYFKDGDKNNLSIDNLIAK